MSRGRRDDDDAPELPGDSDFVPPDQDFPGREFLRGKSMQDVLRRLHEEDPFELFARCEDHIRSQAVLMQADRLYLRTVARIAFAAKAYRGTPALTPWIGERMSIALRELLNDDRESERTALPPNDDADSRFVFLSGAFGIELGLARRACNEFNALPRGVRSTFFAIVMDGKGIQRFATEAKLSPELIRRQLRQAFWRLGVRRDLDADTFDFGKGDEDVV